MALELQAPSPDPDLRQAERFASAQLPFKERWDVASLTYDFHTFL
jgi:hypothetical protein